MPKTMNIALNIAIFLNVTNFIVLHGMESSKKLFEHVRTLPSELQAKILLLHSAITFLGQQPITLTGHTRPIKSVAIHNDKVITRSPNSVIYINGRACNKAFNKTTNDAVKIWDIHTGKCLRTLVKDDAYGDTISSLASYANKIATNRLPFKIIRIWDIDTGECLRILTEPNRWRNRNSMITSLAMNNTHVISGSKDGTIRIWNIMTGKPVQIVKGHLHGITSLLINDTKVVSTSEDCTIKIWTMYNDTCLHILTNDECLSLATSNDILVTKSYYGTIKIWNIHTGTLSNTFNVSDKCAQWAYSIALKDDTVIIGSSDNTTKIWDINTNTCIRTLRPNYKQYKDSNGVFSIAVQDDKIVSGYGNATAKIWPLLINLKGNSDDNPLLWIIEKSNWPQFNFIMRACEATVDEKEFIITFSSDDGKIFLSLPLYIKHYLLMRLKIRR